MSRQIQKCECGICIPMRDTDYPLRCRCGMFYETRTDSGRMYMTPAPSVGTEAIRLNETEVAELLPGETDLTLIGNRLKEVFAAIGFPPCGGCNSRAAWLNSAHLWLRERFAATAA